MIDVSGLIAINPTVNWQLLNRLPETSDIVAQVDSLTIAQRQERILEITSTPIKRQNLTNGYVANLQFELDLLVAALPEPERTENKNRIFEKQRWAPLINDTGNIDFTGTDKHLG